MERLTERRFAWRSDDVVAGGTTAWVVTGPSEGWSRPRAEFRLPKSEAYADAEAHQICV